ncbi:MAG TPA: hypothetical protein VKE70_24245 [Candidatus Solibacter sp.]|nr:hypothetical protein [Candidatus Solibacter sp.]
MRLIDQVVEVCKYLTKQGWADYLLTISDLKIKQSDSAALEAELLRPLAKIERGAAGIEDFALEGTRAIEPGQPARSFLFHVLASPGVGAGVKGIRAMPAPEHLEIIENYVYGVNPPSILELQTRAAGAPLALVVFACEYRPAFQTVHQRHADMCYSRTGVARAGTLPPSYKAEARGYTSFGPKATDVRAIPCRYAAYISARLRGDASNFGPMRFRGEGTVATTGDPVASDSERLFWVPMHKVFPGAECIRDLEPLELRYETDHRNEKIRRIHLYLKQQLDFATGFDEPALSDFPFVVPEERLVDIEASSGGSLMVSPLPHDLSEEATYNGKLLKLKLPPAGTTTYGAYKIPPRPGGGRPAPELIYVREGFDQNGHAVTLNDRRNMLEHLFRGKFPVQHYVDYVGDGWVRLECEQLRLDIPQSLAAYSVISPPDFYPGVKQQDVLNWWTQSAPPDVREHLFLDGSGSIPPEPLSDCRLTANIAFRQPASPGKTEPVFDGSDDSYPAIVGSLNSCQCAMTKVSVYDDQRVSPLPDGASGLFAPGWDISRGQSDDENTGQSVLHLCGYGGSSPFLEDIRICAAQSAFWPAVAPDTARLYEPGAYPSVTPLPESYLGWDGLEAPLHEPGDNHYTFYSIAYTEYVTRGLKGAPGFRFQDIGRVNTTDYKTWSLLMARVYQAMGLVSSHDKAKWALVYFEVVLKKDQALLKEAEKRTGRTLRRPYRFELIRMIGRQRLREDPSRVRVSYDRKVRAFATPGCVLYNDTFNKGWKARDF